MEVCFEFKYEQGVQALMTRQWATFLDAYIFALAGITHCGRLTLNLKYYAKTAKNYTFTASVHC